MATIKKCDHCGRIIKDGRYVDVSLRDKADFFAVDHWNLGLSAELCVECVAPHAKTLCKIFPNIKIKKNTEDKFYKDIFVDKKIIATANKLGRALEKMPPKKKITKKQSKN